MVEISETAQFREIVKIANLKIFGRNLVVTEKAAKRTVESLLTN